MISEVDLDDFFAENPVALTTRKTYTHVLMRFDGATQDMSKCAPADIIKFFKETGWGPSLQYTASTAIKRYCRWRYGAMHPALKLKIKRGKPKVGRVLTREMAEKLLASFDLATVKGKRDYAITCLALDSGLRVNELANIKFADVDFVHHKLQVIVKGGDWEEAVFSVDTGSAIMDWCNHRRLGDDLLFQVTRDGLRVIVRRWGEKLGIRLSPHDLRRSFATLSTKMMGAPTRLVQKAGRWENIEMVELYTSSIEAEDFEPFFPVTRLVNKVK